MPRLAGAVTMGNQGISTSNKCCCRECSHDVNASTMIGAPSANLIATTKAIREFQGPTNVSFRDPSQRIHRQMMDQQMEQRKMRRNSILQQQMQQRFYDAGIHPSPSHPCFGEGGLAMNPSDLAQGHHPMSTGPQPLFTNLAGNMWR